MEVKKGLFKKLFEDYHGLRTDMGNNVYMNQPKVMITKEEAAAYSHIGINKLSKIGAIWIMKINRPIGLSEIWQPSKEARVYLTVDKAKERMQKAPGKTKGYYIWDIGTHSKYYISNGRIKFPKEVREMIYHSTDGKCALCGRKLVYDDMTLDHIIPLAMGGEDNTNNLQGTCKACNLFKGSILPDDFMERVTEIFMYQMEKKNSNKLKRKVIHRMLEKMI